MKSLNSHGSEGQHGTDAEKCLWFVMHSSSPADPFHSLSICLCASLKQRLRPPLRSLETVLLLTPKWSEQTNRPCCPHSDTVLVNRQPRSYWRCPFSDSAWVFWMQLFVYARLFNCFTIGMLRSGVLINNSLSTVPLWHKQSKPAGDLYSGGELSLISSECFNVGEYTMGLFAKLLPGITGIHRKIKCLATIDF